MEIDQWASADSRANAGCQGGKTVAASGRYVTAAGAIIPPLLAGGGGERGKKKTDWDVTSQVPFIISDSIAWSAGGRGRRARAGLGVTRPGQLTPGLIHHAGQSLINMSAAVNNPMVSHGKLSPCVTCGFSRAPHVCRSPENKRVVVKC